MKAGMRTELLMCRLELDIAKFVETLVFSDFGFRRWRLVTEGKLVDLAHGISALYAKCDVRWLWMLVTKLQFRDAALYSG